MIDCMAATRSRRLADVTEEGTEIRRYYRSCLFIFSRLPAGHSLSLWMIFFMNMFYRFIWVC